MVKSVWTLMESSYCLGNICIGCIYSLDTTPNMDLVSSFAQVLWHNLPNLRHATVLSSGQLAFTAVPTAGKRQDTCERDVSIVH